MDVEDLSDVRLGIFDEWFNDADPEVVTACRSAVKALENRGATVVPISIPHLQWMSLSHGIKISSEFTLGFDKIYHSNWDLLEPNTQVTIGIGKSMSALEVISAEKIRAWTFHYVRDLFIAHELTAIVTPTVGVVPPALSSEAKVCGENNNPLVIRMLKYIFMGNFIGMPGYSVPVGYSQPQGSEDYVPIGMHFMGTHWTEHKLLRLANAWDDIFTDSIRRPRQFFADALSRRVKMAQYRKPKDTDEPYEMEVVDGVEKPNIPLKFIP
jgi:Asp-tRNA(Asn)/Glu-tRNA(Gln) amidotransferase A subunit family amidase